MRLGRLLQLWRRREALTLRAAAGKIGINPSTLSRIELGESMHSDTLATVLVWLMGKEEPSANEAFTFEAENDVTGEDQVAERNAAPAGQLERNPYKFDGEEAGAGESSSNTCELERGNSRTIGGLEDIIGGRPWTGGHHGLECIPGTNNDWIRDRHLSSAEIDSGQPFEGLEDNIIIGWQSEPWSDAPGATFEDQPETAAQSGIHAVDKNLAVCGVREEQLGGGAHGAERVEPEIPG